METDVIFVDKALPGGRGNLINSRRWIPQTHYITLIIYIITSWIGDRGVIVINVAINYIPQ